jgi:hypothetical protein
MARFSTPNTDVSFNTHLAPAFSLGTTFQSLTVAGQRIFPRVDSGGTEVSELRNKSFLYAIADIVMFNIDTGTTTTSAGTISVTSPMTIAATSGVISLTPTFIIDDGTYSTITLVCTPAYGFFFVGWSDQNDNTFAFNETSTVSLSNSTLFNATTIRANVFPDI